MVKLTPKQLIEQVLLTGTPQEKRELFSFDNDDPHLLVRKKFKLFARGMYPRFFAVPSAPFHDGMIDNMILSYRGLQDFLNLGFRGCAKTVLTKLFLAFVLLNDKSQFRKFIRILARDQANSKQIVTDVYNLLVEASYVYGNAFAVEDAKKREETMKTFTLADGRKVSSGTVGQSQRGLVQDAYRPDWEIFDDVEDATSVSSVAITTGTITRIDEALNGLARGGTFVCLGNYISDTGVIEWLKNRAGIKVMIVPILNPDGTSAWPEAFSLEDIEEKKQNAEDFFGDYMCDPKRSENKFFDIERIEADMMVAEPPLRESAGVRYWTSYKPNRRYGQASDHSEGIGKDSNALAGFDFTEGLLAYTYANNMIAPDLATHEFARVGGEFGNCVYAPETNNKCGGTAITTLVSIEYPNIYQHEDPTKAKGKVSAKLGWDTNSKTKYNMFMEFRTDYNDGLITILDEDLLKEMKAYSNADLNNATTGLITKHFDLLTAAVIAWQMRKVASASQVTSLKSYSKAYAKYLGESN